MTTSRSNAARAWRRFVRSPSAWCGAILVSGFCFVAIAVDGVAPYLPNQTHAPLLPPSASHWLGTDANQHDVLSRVMYGSRLSLLAVMS